MGSEICREVERFVMLSVIDNLWMNHLDAIAHLQEGIRLQAYAQKDPLVEYKNEAYRMFEQLIWNIDDEIVHRIYKVHVTEEPTTLSPLLRNVVTNTPASEVSEDARQKARSNQQSVSNTKINNKLGRNDPCPCGSGKKWKKCHYPNIP
jgi:preprotein translocase subunit SecA